MTNATPPPSAPATPVPPAAGRWAGIPARERVARRRQMLVHAGFELLGEGGAPAATVRGVCRRTGLHARYFYESFDTVDDLVVAVYDQVVAELVAAVQGAVAVAGPGEPGLRAVIDQTVRFVDEDRRRGRILYVEALGNEALNRRRIEGQHQLVAIIERDAAARRPPAVGGDPIGAISAAILVGGVTELLSAWLDGRIPVGRDQLVADATDLLLGLRQVVGTLATDPDRAARRAAGPG